MKNIAIILAGGTGSRVGGSMPKQLLPLSDGRTMLEHSVQAFEQAECIDRIGIVMHPDYIARAEEMLLRNAWQKVAFIIAGGKERRDSSINAIARVIYELRMMNDEGADNLSNQPINSFNRFNHASTHQPINSSTSSTTHQPINPSTNQLTINILLHDAARPFVSQRIISDVCEALAEHEAVTVAVPATDTMYCVDGDFVQSIPVRSGLMCAQTPQAFRLDVIQRAYRLAAQDPNLQTTDDCGVVHKYLPEVPIYIVRGDAANRKITYREDIGVHKGNLCDNYQEKAGNYQERTNNYQENYQEKTSNYQENYQEKTNNYQENYQEKTSNYQENYQEGLSVREQIVRLLQNNPKLSIADIAHTIPNVTVSGVRYHVNALKRQGILHRVGPDKGGHWEINNATESE